MNLYFPDISQKILPHKNNFLTFLSHPVSVFYTTLPLSSGLLLKVFPNGKTQLLMHLIYATWKTELNRLVIHILHQDLSL